MPGAPQHRGSLPNIRAPVVVTQPALHSLTSLFGKSGAAAGCPPDGETAPEPSADEHEGGAQRTPSRAGQVRADLESLRNELSTISSDVRSLVGRNLSAAKVTRTLKYLSSLTQSGIHKDWIVREAEYGKGHYGVVKYAQNRWDNRPAAVKILPKRDAWGRREVALIEREIDVMREIDHPNCIAMYAHYESRSHFYIVMEPVTGGQAQIRNSDTLLRCASLSSIYLSVSEVYLSVCLCRLSICLSL